MVWGSIAGKDKGTPSLVGLFRLPAQYRHLHSRDPERRWKWNYCRGKSQRRQRRGGGGGRVFCWWSRVWCSDIVRFVTTTPHRSSWIIHHRRSSWASLEPSVTRTHKHARFSLWLMGEERLNDNTRFLWSLTWQHMGEASLTALIRQLILLLCNTFSNYLFFWVT